MRGFWAGLLIAGGLLLPVHAEGQEVSLTLGRFLGDDVGQGPGGLLPTSFGDAGLYGVRVGMGLLLVDVEGSVLIGNTSILDGTPFAVDARFRYVEGSVLLRLFPGPVAPFVAAGIGWHRLSIDLAGIPDYSTIGYNIGAGAKIQLGAIGVRGDLRNHITPLRIEDLDPALASAIGLEGGKTLHNFEVSVGLVLSF